MSPVDVRTGAPDGNFQLFAQVGRRRHGLGHGFIRACVRPCRRDAACPGSVDLVRKSAEPSGVFAFRLSGGGLTEKWMGVQRKPDDELVQLALCDGNRGRCVSPAALRVLAIVDDRKARDGHARLGEINLASPIWRDSRVDFAASYPHDR